MKAVSNKYDGPEPDFSNNLKEFHDQVEKADNYLIWQPKGTSEKEHIKFA